MFEVQDLRYATLATVSRCGMVWFSEDVLSLDMISDNFLLCLRTTSIDDSDDHVYISKVVYISVRCVDTHEMMMMMIS